MCIPNTMADEKILPEHALLAGTGISPLDAARLVRNILDMRGENASMTPMQFCRRVIETGGRHLRAMEVSPEAGFQAYLNSKSHLRPESFRDVRYLGKRLLKSRPDLAGRNFSELSVSDCEAWLSAAFQTPPQFNKGRTMLHGMFEFALRREWCDRNPVRLVERKRVAEAEIRPLSLEEARRILNTAKAPEHSACAAGAAILALAGVRPGEVRRMRWGDIDLEEESITVRSPCSKTGGVRHVEICPALKPFLEAGRAMPDSPVCPPGWRKRWKSIRDESGFKGAWVQDVLRHTYASHHAKHFRDLPRLQLNMGHRDQTLLRSRYVNMSGISKADAKQFFHMRPSPADG